MTKANRLGFPPVPTFAIEGTLRSQALKVLEEAAELVEAAKLVDAVKAYESEECAIEQMDAYAAMIEESADVNQALMNLLDMAGECNGSLSAAAAECTIRNIDRGRLAVESVSAEGGADA